MHQKHRHLFTAPFLAVLALAPTLAAQSAPAGYLSYENRLSRIRFYYPRAYREIPLPPSEEVLVARYVRPKPPRELSKTEKKSYARREAALFAFHFKERSPSTAGSSKPPQGKSTESKPEPTSKKGKSAAKPSKHGPKTIGEAMRKNSLVQNFHEFCSKRLRAFRIERDPKKEGGYLLIYPKKAKPSRATRLGYMIIERSGTDVLGVYGHTWPSHFKRLRSEVTKMSWGLELRKGLGKDLENKHLSRLYEGKDYRDIEKRKSVRRDLAKGWKALDTENFILVYDTRDTKLVKKIARDIECMRKVYREYFPPVKKIEAVSIVRICKNQQEYFQYGGRPGTGGYWHPGNEELVFFDYARTEREKSAKEKRKSKRKLSSKDSYLVLYHEAFHQYIFYAAGSFSPHDWFNEGHGDFFSGAIIPAYGKKVKELGPSKWRLNLAKDQCEYREGFIPLERLLYAERPEFYNRARIGQYYAAAWSFVYFLHKSKEAKKNARWTQLIPNYFQELVRRYHEELKSFGSGATLQQKQVASFKARKGAIDHVLKGIDLPKLQEAWRKYIVRIRNPWKHLRKKHKKERP